MIAHKLVFMLKSTVDCASSVLQITIDIVNTVCACVYLQSLDLIQQSLTRDIDVVVRRHRRHS